MAMLQAARELLHEGERRIGFLLTVGEEVDGAGARHADGHHWSPRYTIVGEDEANAANGLLSVTSPVARALMGKQVDDEVTVKVPKGSRTFEVLELLPHTG